MPGLQHIPCQYLLNECLTWTGVVIETTEGGLIGHNIHAVKLRGFDDWLDVEGEEEEILA